MIEQLIVPGALYEKAKETLPERWVGLLFDVQDVNKEKGMRIVRLNMLEMTDHKSLSLLGNAIVDKYDTRTFSITLAVIAAVSIAMLLALVLTTGITVAMYIVFVAYMTVLGQYYLAHCRHMLEKQKYAVSVLVEVCNVVLIENESDINKSLRARIVQLQTMNGNLIQSNSV